MIQNAEQLHRTREALAQLEAALAVLERDRTTIHPERYAVMEEPIAEDIRRLRAEIDEYEAKLQGELVRALTPADPVL